MVSASRFIVMDTFGEMKASVALYFQTLMAKTNTRLTCSMNSSDCKQISDGPKNAKDMGDASELRSIEIEIMGEYGSAELCRPKCLTVLDELVIFMANSVRIYTSRTGNRRVSAPNHFR